MALGILIEDPRSQSNFTDYAEADMRRWWGHQCKVIREPRGIFIEVGRPFRFHGREGVKRLDSFNVKARVARSTQ